MPQLYCRAVKVSIQVQMSSGRPQCFGASRAAIVNLNTASVSLGQLSHSSPKLHERQLSNSFPKLCKRQMSRSPKFSDDVHINERCTHVVRASDCPAAPTEPGAVVIQNSVSGVRAGAKQHTAIMANQPRDNYLSYCYMEPSTKELARLTSLSF